VAQFISDQSTIAPEVAKRMQSNSENPCCLMPDETLHQVLCTDDTLKADAMI
jgi:hypothetical protein